MPIYMDRHDVSEMVTAEIVAQLHQKDLRIQDQFQCRGLTYWFDEKRKTAFCLVEAPTEKAIQSMHHFAHGEVPNKIIEVDPKIVESFLGRIADPQKAKENTLTIINDPAFRTIMAIRTFFHKSKIKNEISAFNYYKDNVIKLLKLHDGAIVKQKEDYFLVSFKSVSSAIKSAFEIFSSFKGLRDKVFKENTFLKIGLSAGVPVTEKKLFFEDTIKLAERICTSIKGEIIISSEVWELYNSENSTPLPEGAYISTLTETDENFLNLLMDFIESRWNDTNLKVVDLTRPSGCSKSQLYRKMVFLTGKSPNAFIKELRLDRSLGLLNKNNRNISQIAYESGFTSPSYFSKCFQKRFGFSPSEYFLPQ